MFKQEGPSVDGYKQGNMTQERHHHTTQETPEHKNSKEPRGQQKTDITSEKTENNRTAQQDQQQKHGDAPTADLTKAEAWT